MLRKVCPVCEQEMSSGHYCKVCKKFVRSPYVRDITYYLNESHPSGETDCDYHGRVSQSQVEIHGQKQQRAYEFHGKNGKSFGSRNVKIAGIVIGIAVLFMVIPMIVLGLYAVGRTHEIMQPDYGEEDYQYRTLEDDEVKAAGERCSGEGHFTITGDEMDGEIRRFVETIGYDDIREDTYSDNSVYESDTYQYTQYRTEKYYYLTVPEGGGSDMVALDWDTATGELHRVDISFEDSDRAVAVMECVLGELVEAGDLPADDYYETGLKDEVLANLAEDAEDGFWYELPDGEEGVNLYINGGEDGVYIGIWKSY